MARLPHVPTDKQRQMIQIAKAAGLTDEQIAGLIAIDLKTLRKHYRAELDNACAKAVMTVAANLYKRATSDAKEAVPAAIFWLKTRGGWRETDQQVAQVQPITSVRVEVIGANQADSDATTG